MMTCTCCLYRVYTSLLLRHTASSSRRTSTGHFGVYHPHVSAPQGGVYGPSADFEITGEDLMNSFLGFEVEQLEGCIKLQLDTYIKEEYQLIVISPNFSGRRRCL
jgi:hypothetical protein